MTRELAKEELPGIIALYAKAGKAKKDAGFDGIELHCAHAYMLLGSFCLRCATNGWMNTAEVC